MRERAPASAGRPPPRAGALALIEPGEVSGEVETVGIELLDSFFAAGRDFDLALPETR